MVRRHTVGEAETSRARSVGTARRLADDLPLYPAAYPEVLPVGATDKTGSLTDFSSWGDHIDVAAPGFDILSTGLN